MLTKPKTKTSMPVLTSGWTPNGSSGGPFFQGAGAGYSNEFGKAAAGAQGAKDVAAFNALGGLGVAGQNAMAQYGASRNAALTNQSVAQANAYGQLGNSYFNTLGQLGYIGSALTSAGLNAGAQSASATQRASANFGGGGGGGGGFRASGPEGTIASGRTSGGYGGGGGGGGQMSGSVSRGASREEREGMVGQGYGFLSQLRGDLNSPNNAAMQFAGEMTNQFNANRAATMDPTITNSLNAQVDAGYGALSGLYGMSDYGFNTGRRGYRGGSFSPDAGSPGYWMNPSSNRYNAPRRPGGRFRL